MCGAADGTLACTAKTRAARLTYFFYLPHKSWFVRRQLNGGQFSFSAYALDVDSAKSLDRVRLFNL